MSGFSPFGLSALGSMSTLGNLASAQRLDHLNDLLSRNPNSNWNRDKPRRSLDDDYFGGSGTMGGGNRNRRSLSPPRHFDRDDRRNNNPRRDRGNQRRNRGSDKFGSSSGAGILGAAPSLNDSMPGPSLSGLNDQGGFGSSNTWNDRGGGGGAVPQLNSQTQQILNMMQTQQLLAAVQAQASLSNSGPPSLMQNQIHRFPRQGGRNQRNDNQGRDRFRSGGGGGRYKDDRKRKSSPPRNPLPKRDRRENNSQATRSDKKEQSAKKTVAQNDKESSKKNSNKESKASKDVEEQEKQQDSSATEEQMDVPSQNAAGEDIKALVSGNFDGKRYWCSLCKVVCLKSKNIYKHYLSKRHVKAAVESEGKTFDPEIMKETPKPQDISELLKYVCNTRKIARKEKNDVYISSQTECTVKISDFATKQNFMGSEFVKAISGFKCQLCKVFLRSGHDVLYHIQGKRHKNNYEAYLKDHPTYPDTQFEVNKNLVEILEKQEGKDVLLFEVKNDEAVDGVQKADDAEENCKLEENDDEDDGAVYNMDEYDPTEDSKIEAEDSNVVDDSTTQEETIVEETGMSEAPLEEVKTDHETEEEVEKNLLQEDGEEQEEEESQDVSQEEQLLLTPSEEKVQIPFLEATADTKPEDKTESKESEQENSKDEKEDMKSPATSGDLGLKEDEGEEEEVTPISGKRVTRKGRGRGGNTRATRGKAKRRNTRAAKNLKKAEEVDEVVEEATPKETNEDIAFIDGFEVIDEIVGGEDDD